MPPRKSTPSSFVARHSLWSGEQARAAAAMEKAIAKHKLELVRFAFCDQHGVLRGKTLVASETASALRNGVTMTSTLLAKDTSHRSVFPVFSAGGGMNIPEMQGAGNFIMVADPATFCVLPWAPNTGWVLCDCYFPNGKPVPFSTRQLYRDALGLPQLPIPAPPTMAFFMMGNVRLMIAQPEPGFTPGGSGTMLYLTVERIAEAAAAMEARGVKFIRGAHMIAKLPDREVWLAEFKDPDGNPLALMSEVKF